MADEHNATNPPTWTAEDQARADNFEQQILAVADKWTGHPHGIVVAFVQATGSLMRRGLQADLGQLGTYQEMLIMLTKHVTGGVGAPKDPTKH